MSDSSSCDLSKLIVNEDVFEGVIAEIDRNNGSVIPQPVMIIGPDGSGKTTLLSRILEYGKDRGRPTAWIDGRSLFCSEDIILKVVDRNASIVLIDDMDFYLTRCSYEEQYRLRRFLFNEGAPMLIACVSKVLPALTDYEAPFFEGMRHLYINPVSQDIINESFNQKDAIRVHSLMNLLPSTIGSLEIACRIINDNALPEKDISILISIFSDKYRTAYQNLPVNSQNILNAFGGNEIPMTLPELRNKTGLSTNILTAYLKTMNSLDIIRVDKSVKRNSRYSMKDPLFRLWLRESEPVV